MSHPDTIGSVEFGGLVYDIDWPFELDSDQRESSFAVVYLDDVQIAEFYPYSSDSFSDEEEVMEAAREFVKTDSKFIKES